VALYLLSLVLVPWTWFPPFPWLHVHAQWSDAILAAAVVVWTLDRWRSRDLPRLGMVHAAMGLYVATAATSLALTDPPPVAGAPKVLGMASLAALAIVTADLASRPGVWPWIVRVVAATTLLTAAGAVAGVGLFLVGIPTPLVGTYGDLRPGMYARAQAGFGHPNILASYCIFASGAVASVQTTVSPRIRRALSIALTVTVLLTFSRGILAFACAALVRRTCDPGTRRQAVAGVLACVGLLGALSVWNFSLHPLRPLEARVEPGPSSRLQAISSAWRTFLARPLLGSGPGTSPGTRDGIPFDAHLTPLNIAATLGLPALVAFLTIPLLLWHQRRRPTNLALWGALTGIGLDSLAQDVEDFRHLWVLFGLLGGEVKEQHRGRSGQPSAVGHLSDFRLNPLLLMRLPMAPVLRASFRVRNSEHPDRQAGGEPIHWTDLSIPSTGKVRRLASLEAED
jgi:hypothetical protein